MRVRATDAPVITRILLLDPDAGAAADVLAALRATDLSLDLRRLDGTDAARLATELDDFQPQLLIAERDLAACPAQRLLELARPRELPVLFLCERVDDAFAARVLRAGAADCVAKAETLRLAATVERALHRAAERRTQQRIARELIRARRYESLPTLLSALAHDLRNVLQPLMFAGVVLRRSEDPALQRLQETLDNTTQKGLDIVSSMMAFCRTDVPEDDLNVPSLLRNLRLLLPKKVTRNVEVSFESALGTVACRLNQSEIEQCLLGLGLGAIRAMPDGGRLCFRLDDARLDAASLAAGENVAPGDYLRLSVEGSVAQPAGEDEEADDPGLVLCRAVAMRHAGLLRVRTAPGAGTTVELYLPLRAVTGAQAGPRTPQAVLFATHDDGAAHSLAQAGSPLGFDVARVADSSTAAQYLERNRLPDLAIIDTDLPRLEDARVFSLLREHRFAGSVILLASPGADMAHDATAGSVRLITKPVDNEGLIAALRDCAAQYAPDR